MCQYFYYVNRPKDNKYLVVFIHTSKTVELQSVFIHDKKKSQQTLNKIEFPLFSLFNFFNPSVPSFLHCSQCCCNYQSLLTSTNIIFTQVFWGKCLLSSAEEICLGASPGDSMPSKVEVQHEGPIMQCCQGPVEWRIPRPAQINIQSYLCLLIYTHMLIYKYMLTYMYTLIYINRENSKVQSVYFY